MPVYGENMDKQTKKTDDAIQSNRFMEDLDFISQQINKVQWNLINKQKFYSQVIERQRKQLNEQEKIIKHLTKKLGLTKLDLDLIQTSAVVKVPNISKVMVEDDSDSAIVLDSSYSEDCKESQDWKSIAETSDWKSSNKSSLKLERSVSDVLRINVRGDHLIKPKPVKPKAGSISGLQKLCIAVNGSAGSQDQQKVSIECRLDKESNQTRRSFRTEDDISKPEARSVSSWPQVRPVSEGREPEPTNIPINGDKDVASEPNHTALGVAKFAGSLDRRRRPLTINSPGRVSSLLELGRRSDHPGHSPGKVGEQSQENLNFTMSPSKVPGSLVSEQHYHSQEDGDISPLRSIATNQLANLQFSEGQTVDSNRRLRRCESEKAPRTSFSSPLYRGYLLRHRQWSTKLPKYMSRDPSSSTSSESSAAAAPDSITCTEFREALGPPTNHRSVLTPRDVKNRNRRKTINNIHPISTVL